MTKNHNQYIYIITYSPIQFNNIYTVNSKQYVF